MILVVLVIFVMDGCLSSGEDGAYRYLLMVPLKAFDIVL